MSHPSLLAHLALSFGLHSEERVATESLAFLLNECSSARFGLHKYVAEAFGVEVPDLTYRSEDADPKTGRPDLIGIVDGDRSNVRLIVEGKLWAPLTDKQPDKYLERLTEGQPGLLLVVAPQERLHALWKKLLDKVQGLREPAAENDALPLAHLRDSYVARLRSGHLLVLRKWRDVLDAIERQLRVDSEEGYLSDLSQLRWLTERYEQPDFVPVEDLDIGIGRQVNQMYGLTRTLVNKLVESQRLKRKNEDRRISPGGGEYYGSYLMAGQCQKEVWIGFFPGAWAEYGFSPIWLEVRSSPAWGWTMPRLRETLQSVELANGAELCERPSDRFWIPLMIAHYAEEEDVLDELARQVLLVVDAIDAHAPR
jgi:hypothetical protein